MEEDTGLMNVNADTIAVAAHFFLNDQLVRRKFINAAGNQNEIEMNSLSWILWVIRSIPIDDIDIL